MHPLKSSSDKHNIIVLHYLLCDSLVNISGRYTPQIHLSIRDPSGLVHPCLYMQRFAVRYTSVGVLYCGGYSPERYSYGGSGIFFLS